MNRLTTPRWTSSSQISQSFSTRRYIATPAVGRQGRTTASVEWRADISELPATAIEPGELASQQSVWQPNAVGNRSIVGHGDSAANPVRHLIGTPEQLHSTGIKALTEQDASASKQKLSRRGVVGEVCFPLTPNVDEATASFPVQIVLA